MSRFTHWLRRFGPAGSCGARKPKRRKRVHLTAEALEERALRTVMITPHFGAETQHDAPEESLSSPTVELIFWGPQNWWMGPSGSGSSTLMQQYATAASNVVSSGYVSGVSQYGSDGKAQLFSSPLFDYTNPLPLDIGKDEIESEKDQLQSQGKLPSGSNMIYAFITPYWVGHDPTVGGKNWVDDGDNIIWDANTFNVDNFSATFSHELAESMSSPDGDGFMVNPGPAWPDQGTSILGVGISGWGQIADFEASNYGLRMSNGVEVEPYWSQQDQQFIVPDGTSLQQFWLTPNYNGGTFAGNYNLTITGDLLPTTTDDQYVISTTTVNGNTELSITANGETVLFDQGALNSINIAAGSGHNKLTLNALPSGFGPGGSQVQLVVGSSGDLNVVYTGSNTVQGSVLVSVGGKLTVTDATGPADSISINGGSVTVANNSPLEYLLSSQGSLEVDAGAGSSVTVQSTPFGGQPLSIVTTDVNNKLALQGLGGPLTISTFAGDTITASFQQGGQWTLDNASDPHNLDITINNNVVQYHDYVAITLQGMQALTLNSGTGHTDLTVEGTLAPLTLNTGTSTNEVDLAASSGAVTINARGADTVIVGSAQTLSGIGPVTLHGDLSTVLTVNDQANPAGTGLLAPFTQYTLYSGTLTRAVSFPGPLHSSSALTISYSGVTSLTLNAGNSGANTVNVESMSIPTTIVGGTATGQINVADQSQNLDSIGAYLNISGTSANVAVYDQADSHGAASGTPIAYVVGNDGVTRDAVVSRLALHTVTVHTRIDTVPVKSVTLYTSQSSGSSPNTVHAGSGTSAPVTLISGAADAITVGLGGPVTLAAHGGTVTLDDRALQNDDSDGTTDTFTLGYTVTDHTVVRNEHWHMVEIIDPGSVPPNPADPRPSHAAVVIRDYYYNGTLNYQNVKSLTLLGGPVTNTFTVQSTPAGMPVAINGGGTDQFIVGANGSVKNIRSQLMLNGSPSDTLLVDDSLATLQDKVTIANGKANDVQLGMAATDQFFASGGGLDCSGIGSLTLNLSKAAGDVVALSPSAVTAFFMNANGTGAELDLYATGLSPQETLTGPGTGKFTFGSARKTVSFQSIGSVKTR